MPYFMRKEDGKFCVYQGTAKDPIKLLQCYDAAEDASDYMRALQANAAHGKNIDEPQLPAADWESMTAEEIMSTVGKDVTSVGDEQVEQDKEVWDTAMINNLPDSAFLYVEDGDKDDEGKTIPRSKRHLPYKDSSGKIDLPHLRNAISRLGQPATGKGWLTPELREKLLAKAQKLLGSDDMSESDDKKSLEDKFVVYKSESGEDRWLAISNVAIQDREFETITDKAYDDAISLGQQLGYGELDLVHVDGTDVGDCDLMLRMGDGQEARLVEGGTWHNTPLARRALKAVQEDPSYWGVSIKFVYDPVQFIDGVYHGGIRIKKRTILPRRMAASYGTAIAVLGGEQKMKELDQETRNALSKLGVEESKIEELAERSKSLPDEKNTVTKNESSSIIDQIKSLIDRALGKEKSPGQEAANPDVEEQSKETETEVVPVEPSLENVEEVTDVEKEAPVEIDKPNKSEAPSEIAKSVAEAVAQSLAPSIKVAVQPINDQLAAIAKRQDDIEKRLLETEKDIETRVVEKIESLPPVVKVRTTELKQAETDEPISGLAVPTTQAEDQATAFVKAVQDIVAGAFKQNASIMPDLKLSTEEVSNE